MGVILLNKVTKIPWNNFVLSRRVADHAKHNHCWHQDCSAPLQLQLQSEILSYMILLGFLATLDDGSRLKTPWQKKSQEEKGETLIFPFSKQNTKQLLRSSFVLTQHYSSQNNWGNYMFIKKTAPHIQSIVGCFIMWRLSLRLNCN